MKERASSQHDAIPFSEESRNKQYIYIYVCMILLNLKN